MRKHLNITRILAFTVTLACLLTSGLPAYAVGNGKANAAGKPKADPVSVSVAGAGTATAGAADSSGTADSALSDQVECVNVMDYGAVADGITDDSAACQRALNAAKNRDLPLYFPAGTYNLNAQYLGGSKSKLTIFGDGEGKTVITHMGQIYTLNSIDIHDLSFTESSGYLLYIAPQSDLSIHLQNVSCTGLEEYQGPGALLYVEYGAFHVTDLSVDHCYVSRFDRAVQVLSNIDSAAVTNCTFEDLGDSTAKYVCGVALGDDRGTMANNVLVSGNTISNLYTAVSPDTSDYTQYTRAYGILAYGENIEISDNHVENIIGGYAHSGIYTKSPNAKILNNEIINAGDGGGCIVNKDAQTTDSVIQGNRIYADQSPAATGQFVGILFKGTNVTIEDNDISLLSGGIVMELYNDDGYSFESCNVSGNRLETTGYYAVYLNHAGGNVEISDNEVTQDNQSDVLYPASLTFTEAGAGSKINVSNNTVATNAMVVNSWKCSSSAIIHVSGNSLTFDSSRWGYGMYFDAMKSVLSD